MVTRFYWAFPVVYPLACAALFRMPWDQVFRILLSPTFYVLALMSWVIAWSLTETKAWAWHSTLAFNLLVTYNNAVWLAERGKSGHKIEVFIICCLFTLLLTMRITRELRVPYFMPRIRWWESDPRYRLVVPVQILRTNGSSIDAEILDISLSGCFVKSRQDYEEDETMILQFQIFGHPIRCAGTIVWKADSGVTHPKGIGVKFAPITQNQKRLFQAIDVRLKELSSLYSKSRYLVSEEIFFEKMAALQSQELFLSRKRRRRRAKPA